MYVEGITWADGGVGSSGMPSASLPLVPGAEMAVGTSTSRISSAEAILLISGFKGACL